MFKPRLPKDKQMRQGVSNIEWATPKSRRAPEIHQQLDDMATDILCLCEAYSEFREGRGHRIECDEDYGYNTQLGRRKACSDQDSPGTMLMSPETRPFHQGVSCQAQRK